MKCPKCHKQAYGGQLIERKVRLASPPWVKVYHYRQYRHYKGSKKSISLKALQQILDKYEPQAHEWHLPTLFKTIESEIKERAGSKVVYHYGPV